MVNMDFQYKRLSPELSKEVISALGGTTEVSRICVVQSAAVSQWKKNGIPRARLMFLRERFKNKPIMQKLEIRFF